MGNFWSSRRRNNYFQYPPPPPPPPHLPSPYYYSAESHPPLPPPPPPQGYIFTPATSYTPPSTSYVTPPPLPAQPPPPPPPHTHSFYSSNGYSNYGNSMTGRFHYHPFYVNQPSGWPAIRPPVVPADPPPPYVDHQTAKKVRNDVNVHKDTLRLEVDEHNPDHHLVSFVFDALYDGSITVFYFAKEEETCKFIPLYPEAFEPVKIPFQKGAGQKFCQPSGTGIDLGFFELDDLSKPSQEEVFPLVICAETFLRTPSANENLGDSMPDVSPHMQITQAVIEKSGSSGSFQVKVVRQILWIDGVRYELRELYGIGSSATADFTDNDPGKEECVICMTEPKDTAVLPCRHMCMCSECAKALRLQSNKCPICRQSIEELMEIKINNSNQ